MAVCDWPDEYCAFGAAPAACRAALRRHNAERATTLYGEASDDVAREAEADADARDAPKAKKDKPQVGVAVHQRQRRKFVTGASTLVARAARC